MNEVEIIQGARELLSDPKRWGKGGADRDDTFCVLGALSVVAGEDCYAFWGKHKQSTLHNARRLVEQHVPVPFSAAWTYNDDRDTTHEDILNLLDKTLADLGAL